MLNGWYGYMFGGRTDNNDDDASAEGADIDGGQLCKESQGTIDSASGAIENGGDEEWILVADECIVSGRSSPVLVAEPELYEFDDASSVSENNSAVSIPSAVDLRRVEALKAARALSAQRNFLTEKLFAGHNTNGTSTSGDVAGSNDDDRKVSKKNQGGHNSVNALKGNGNINNGNGHHHQTSAGKMKRATAAAMAQNECKIKPRSKKGLGQMNACRNNDRKCNNLN